MFCILVHTKEHFSRKPLRKYISAYLHPLRGWGTFPPQFCAKYLMEVYWTDVNFLNGKIFLYIEHTNI